MKNSHSETVQKEKIQMEGNGRSKTSRVKREEEPEAMQKRRMTKQKRADQSKGKKSEPEGKRQERNEEEKWKCEDAEICGKKIKQLEVKVRILQNEPRHGRSRRKQNNNTVRKIYFLERKVGGDNEFAVEYEDEHMVKMSKSQIKQLHFKEYVRFLESFF